MVKKISVSKACVIASCLLSSFYVKTASAESVKSTVSAHIAAADLQLCPGKKLVSPQAELLSTYLETQPTVIIRMDKVCGLAIKVARDLENAKQAEGKSNVRMAEDKERAFCSEKIKFIMEPVKEFFGFLNGAGISDMVTPLIRESLLTNGSSRGIGSSMLLEYFSSGKTVEDFFNERVTTKAQLMNTCAEFVVFFKDLKASLSEKARKAYADTVEKIKRNQREHKPK